MLTIKNVYTKRRHVMNFVPFIDVVFMLLMFFFVAAEIRPTEADFKTNERGGGVADGFLETKYPIRVWVAETAAGPVAWLGGEKNGKSYTSFDELSGKLEGIKGPHSVVVIDGPGAVSVQTVALAMDAAMKAGIPMTLANPSTEKGSTP